jgi:hypothetical protein
MFRYQSDLSLKSVKWAVYDRDKSVTPLSEMIAIYYSLVNKYLQQAHFVLGLGQKSYIPV